MMRFPVVFITILFLAGCKKEHTTTVPEKAAVGFQSVSVDPLLNDSLSIRALLPRGSKIWYAANNGRYGFYDLAKKTYFDGHVSADTLSLEFRSITATANNVFVLNVGSPALLYRIADDGKRPELVYRENHPKAFYDSLQFFDAKNGIAMGDPTEGCLSVLLTHDGGATWQKLPCDQLPPISDGEAAFAASNTNLVLRGNDCWMVSGGKRARVFHSGDRGQHWQVFETPIIQGQTMTGIFSADFYDAKNGIIAGGDYEKPKANDRNLATTGDGGKTWKIVGANSGVGYVSCVQYVPGSNARELVCVGANGIQYSQDAGEHWKTLSANPKLFTLRFVNDSTAYAAGKNQLLRLDFRR